MNWLLGNSDMSTVLKWCLLRWGHSPYEMGAFAAPYEMGAFPLRGECGVPGLLPGVDHWTVSPDVNGVAIARMRKRKR